MEQRTGLSPIAKTQDHWHKRSHFLTTSRVSAEYCISVTQYVRLYFCRRHVLKLHAKSPIAYHLTVLSNAEFQLTDEDNIYTFLSKVRFVQCIPNYIPHLLRLLQESSLYTSFCSEFMDSLVKSAKHLGSSVDLKASLRPLVMQMSSVGLTAQHSMVGTLIFLCKTISRVFNIFVSPSAVSGECVGGLVCPRQRVWTPLMLCDSLGSRFFYKSFALLEKELPRSGGVGNIQQMRRSLNNKRNLLENKSSSDER